jgi:hypothetical protein
MGRGKDGVIYCMDSLGGAAGWGSTANNAVLVRLRELAATHNWGSRSTAWWRFAAR